VTLEPVCLVVKCPRLQGCRVCFYSPSPVDMGHSARMKVSPRQGCLRVHDAYEGWPGCPFGPLGGLSGMAQAEGLEPSGMCEHGVWWQEGDRKAGVGFTVAQLL